LEKIAKKHRIKLLFDAAHGLGSLYKGRPLGREGDVSVFSTSPTKLLTTGEGGLVATNNKKIAEKIRIGREYGNPGNYNCQFVGLNGRLGEIQALLGIEGLKMLERNSKRRNRLAQFYQQNLQKLSGICFQKINTKGCSSYKDFSIVIKTGEFGLSRDELAKILEKKGIETRKYFFPALHQQRAYLCYRKKYIRGLPVTNYLAQNILSLPISSVMKKSTIKQICKVISKTHSKCKK
jgi:dTDP-4-amino-4,6-dideoxygalactose transaminase